MTAEHVESAISAVSATIFPHRALETQRTWMSRYMRKPFDMSSRSCSAAISRINNALPLFPNANASSKFTEAEMIGLMEWSLPKSWRDQFDLKGFDPLANTREQLVFECELIERHIPAVDPEKDNKSEKKENKFCKSGGNNKKGDKKQRAQYHCKECGSNRTHDTKDCFKIKNREKRAADGNGYKKPYEKQAFSKRTFRKEVNVLARTARKNGEIKQLAHALKREQDKEAQIQKSSAAKKRVDFNSEPESSDSDASMHSLEEAIPKKARARAMLKKVSSLISHSRPPFSNHRYHNQ